MRPLKALANTARRRLWMLRHGGDFRDSGPARRPRLLVDISVITRHDAGTGIQRVVRSVWSHLEKLHAAEFDVVPVYATAARGYCYAPADFLSPGARLRSEPVRVLPGDKFLGLDLAAQFLPRYAGQIAAWRAAGASVHVVVYDLLPLRRPDWFEPSTSRHFSKWVEVIMAQADQALCISQSVADELRRKTIGTPAHQRLSISRLHLSGDIAGSLPSIGYSPKVLSMLQRARMTAPVLMIGTIEPRKAYDRALDAFEHLWAADPESGPDLLIIGKSGWKTAELQERILSHPEHGRRLHWLEGVSDEALTQFYLASRAVFLATYDEGYGLPAVEAATNRRWALVRDLPVFREQQLPNLRYFTDDSPQALARELEKLLELARHSAPPAASPAKWCRCVDGLLEELGMFAKRAPVLRAVS